MKKIIYIIIVVMLIAMASPMRAQILTMDQEENSRMAGDLEELGRIPVHNVDYDQANAFAPVGEGIMLLAALGGAYLLAKGGRRRGETQADDRHI